MEINQNQKRIAPQVVAQFHHRLLALEVELREQARDGAIEERDLAKRLQKLRTVQAKLRSLREASRSSEGLATDMGLPQVSQCGSQELEVCDAYLQHRCEALRSVNGMLGKITKWVEDAAMGRSGFLAVIRRLSHMRKFIAKCENLLTHQQEQEQWVNRYAEDILSAMPSGKDGQAANTLDSLIAMFNRMDHTVSRVARLRAKQKRLKHDVRLKEAWLREQENIIDHYRPAFAPPQPTVLWNLRKRDKTLSLLDDINSRRVKVQRFWDSVLDDSDIGKPSRRRTSLTTNQETKK